MIENTEISSTRRNLLLAGGVAALGALTAIPVLAADNHDEHKHHHHHSENSNTQLMKAALDCMYASQLCYAHCLSEFKMGKTDMADCAQAVQESAIMCSALMQMAAMESQHLKITANVCLAVCESCKKECDKFAKIHKVCKDCSDSCSVLIKQLKTV